MREGKGSTWPRKQNWKKRKKTQRNTKIFEVCVNCSCYWIAEKSLLPPHSWVAFNITDTFQLTHPIQSKRKRNPQKMFIGKTAMGWPPCFLELKCLCIGRALLKLSMLLKNASCYKTYGSPTKKKSPLSTEDTDSQICFLSTKAHTSKWEFWILIILILLGVLWNWTITTLLHTVLDRLHANCSWLINTNCMTKKIVINITYHITHFRQYNQINFWFHLDYFWQLV